MWPLHIIAIAAGLAILVLAVRRTPGHGLWIALILAVLWAFVGWSFLWVRYAAINWSAAYVAPAFWLEALLLAPIGVSRGCTRDRNGASRWLGLTLAALGIVLYPLLPPLSERPWTSAEIFGIAPDPTAIATLGVLLARPGRYGVLLSVIPLLWLVLSGLTLLAMGDAQAALPLTAVAAGVAGFALCSRMSAPTSP